MNEDNFRIRLKIRYFYISFVEQCKDSTLLYNLDPNICITFGKCNTPSSFPCTDQRNCYTKIEGITPKEENFGVVSPASDAPTSASWGDIPTSQGKTFLAQK